VADKHVLDNSPIVHEPLKVGTKQSAPPIPYRCFRTIAPKNLAAKHDGSLIYLVMLGNSQVPTHTEVSTLWGVAYLEDLLSDGSYKMDFWVIRKRWIRMLLI
jgi:hypothetical protein